MRFTAGSFLFLSCAVSMGRRGARPARACVWPLSCRMLESLCVCDTTSSHASLHDLFLVATCNLLKVCCDRARDAVAGLGHALRIIVSLGR